MNIRKIGDGYGANIVRMYENYENNIPTTISMYQWWTLRKSGAPWCHCFAQFIHWPFGDFPEGKPHPKRAIVLKIHSMLNLSNNQICKNVLSYSGIPIANVPDPARAMQIPISWCLQYSTIHGMMVEVRKQMMSHWAKTHKISHFCRLQAHHWAIKRSIIHFLRLSC